jgi:nucleoside 2-deoxyribosyltransferase
MKVYLAGPITGHTYDGAEDWRALAREVLGRHGIEAFSPLRGKEYLRAEGMIGAYVQSEAVMSSPKGITTRDRWDCTRVDIVLVNFVGAERISVGTCIELGWADGARVPIVAVMPEGNVHEHPMVEELVGFRVHTLGEALALITTMDGGPKGGVDVTHFGDANSRRVAWYGLGV